MSQSKSQSIERECTEKCKSKQHGNNLCSAITKRGVSDSDLCAYLQWKCSCCGQVVDSIGRSALHFAASCGRRQVIQWLVRNKGANVNLKDFESGYTPLHRSIFYGKINSAVTLMRLGANIGLTDYSELTAIEHAIKDRIGRVEYSSATPCQVYVWGTNTNYTLGTVSQQTRHLPELLEVFHKRNTNIYIKQASLQKFHNVLVSLDGRVFSCGHGQGGRLGVNSENTVITPQEIKFNAAPFVCSEASIGRDHSVFLSDCGQVWTCGLNTYHVLGIKPPPSQALVPKLLPDFRNQIKGICAGRFHSVAWGPTAVYTWGLHAGQLGHDKNTNQTYITPKLVTNFWGHDVKIVSVTASDGATVVSTERGDIYVLHEYQCRKIASRKLNISKIVVVGGHLNSKLGNNILVDQGGNELKVLILMSSGNLFLWQQTWPQLTRCIFNISRSLIIKDVFLNRSEVLFVTSDGEAFRGEFSTKKKKTIDWTVPKIPNDCFMHQEDTQMVKVNKFPHIHRAIKIESDLKGSNYAVLQTDPCFSLIDIPLVSNGIISADMLQLLNDSDEMDTIHDAIFKVGKQTFAVHKYIIAMQSDYLYSMIEKCDSDEHVEIKDVHPLLFQQILLYIYTGNCDLIKCGECPSALKRLNNPEINTNLKISDYPDEIHMMEDLNISAYEYYNKKRPNKKMNKVINDSVRDPVRQLQEASKKFGVKSLYKLLDNYIYVDGSIKQKNKKNERNVQTFDRSMHKNLHDVYIKTKTGVEIAAHKCILAGRLEYFNNLFAVRWNETSTRNVISLPYSHVVMQHIMDYLYEDKSIYIESCDDIDYISDVLLIADELFIDRLKEICEVALSTRLTLRNAAQMLQFSSIYNAPQLKRCTMEFICLNLSAIIESRILEPLEDDVMDDLTNYYCDWNPILSKRVMTPHSDAPSDEEVKNVSEMFPVILKSEGKNNSCTMKQQKTGAKRKLRMRKISSSENVKNKAKNDNPSTPSAVNVNLIMTNIEKPPEEIKPDEKWVKILTEKEKHKKIVQARLRAIAVGEEEIANDKVFNDTFTKLTSSPKTIPKNQNTTNGSPIQSPGVTSPLPSPTSSELAKSPPVYEIPIQVTQKLSQKQRKKLAQIPLGEQLNALNQKQSFEFVESPSSTNAWGVSDMDSSPKSPWQKIESPVLATTPEIKQNFIDIVANEKKRKGNWTKMRAKALNFTQMEDKAIEDLNRFYNIDGISDEYITIHRVETGTFAVPQWVHTNNKH